MKAFKKLAAMGAAVMMMASVSAMNVGAAKNTYSLYISNYGAVTSDTCETGPAAHDDYINLAVTISKLSKGAGITYSVTVGGTNVGGVNTRISSTGTYSKKYSHNNIESRDRILVTVRLAPSPAGIGSSASGSVSGS